AIPGIPHAVPVAVPPPKPPPVARVVPPRAPGTPPAPPRTPPPEPAREEAPLAPVASASGLFDALASPLKVGGFYASHMGGLWKLFQESMPLLHPARDHQREFRLEAANYREDAYFHDNIWHVQLPECCVVCGEDTERESD